MGVVRNINFDTFPEQGTFLGMKVNVYFHYDTSKMIGGVVVRNDVEIPFITIIKLDNGRFVLATEYQYCLTP